MNPLDEYGLPFEEANWLLDLNRTLREATFAAADAACAAARARLGIESDALTQMHLADPDSYFSFSCGAADYLRVELAQIGIKLGA